MPKGFGNKTYLRRFLEKVSTDIYDPQDCWVWGSVEKVRGYPGYFYLGAKRIRAHRASVILFRGSIQESMTVDHVCRNRSCVNPNHLDCVSLLENKARAPLRFIEKRPYCSKGHLYLNDSRICGSCQKINLRNFRAKKRQRSLEN